MNRFVTLCIALALVACAQTRSTPADGSDDASNQPAGPGPASSAAPAASEQEAMPVEVTAATIPEQPGPRAPSEPDSEGTAGLQETGTAGDDGAAAPSAGSPETPAREGGYWYTGDPGMLGPYQVESYGTTIPHGFGPAQTTVRYPADGDAGERFPAVIVAPGASYTNEDMTWIGTHLSSHGYITVSVDQPLVFGVDASWWGESVINGLALIKTENDTPGSPIEGMLDTAQIGTMGYSAGGGGALWAATQSDEIRTVVGLAPAVNVVGSPPSIEVPFLEICGEVDDVVPPDACNGFYDNHADDFTRSLVFVSGRGHWVNTDDTDDLEYLEIARRQYTAWFGYVLKGLQIDYEPFVYGAQLQQDIARGTLVDVRYVTP